MGLTAFSTLCSQALLPLCSLVGPETPFDGTRGILPNCYARSIEVANTIIFQGANDIAHIGALVMTIIMIFHIRTKFTAVGRREIVTFFYIYVLLTLCSLVLDAGVIPPATTAYIYFTSVQNGLISALCTSLLINGFVGFQLYEDGTILSVWLLRIASAIMFGICFIVSLMTFKSWGALSPTNLVALFVVLYVLNVIFVAVYVLMQFFLVLRTLQDRWPLFHITFGVIVFVAGQVILYQFGTPICQKIAHYADGMICATLANLFAVMMIYKFWDSITKEDLEFSVGLKQHAVEATGLLQPREQIREPFDSRPQYDTHQEREKLPVQRPEELPHPGYAQADVGYDYEYGNGSPPPWQRNETPRARRESHHGDRYENERRHRNSRDTRDMSRRPWDRDRPSSKSRPESTGRPNAGSRPDSRARPTLPQSRLSDEYEYY